MSSKGSSSAALSVAGVFNEASQAFRSLATAIALLQSAGSSTSDGSQQLVGKWTQEEIELLRDAVKRFGTDIDKICQVVKTRTRTAIQAQIRLKARDVYDGKKRNGGPTTGADSRKRIPKLESDSSSSKVNNNDDDDDDETVSGQRSDEDNSTRSGPSSLKRPRLAEGNYLSSSRTTESSTSVDAVGKAATSRINQVDEDDEDGDLDEDDEEDLDDFDGDEEADDE